MARVTRSRIPATRRAVEQAAARGLDTVIDEGKAVRDARCPVDTGQLLASGETLAPSPLRRILQEGRGLPDRRAWWTEIGTARAPAQPHMYPAADHMKRRARPVVAAEIKKVLR